jgi:rubrerythrin
MIFKTLNDVLDFAISNEKKSIHFYETLKDKAVLPAIEIAIQELINMEKQHVFVLHDLQRSVSHKEFDAIEIEVEHEIDEDGDRHILKVSDLVKKAIAMEKAAYELYTQLCQKYKGTELESIFAKIAIEEASHEKMFENLT